MGKKSGRRKKVNHDAHAIKAFTGFRFRWQDPDPLAEGVIEADDLSHKNPVYNARIKPIAQKFGHDIRERLRFRWLLTIEVVNRRPGVTYVKPIELEASCRYVDLMDEFEKQVELQLYRANLNHYQYMQFTAEILGAPK